ncbi:hypothetical protein B0H19DRAFT_1367834 [Mycena capillaripes]|nr:hypothetical protein B0H19DRAFT_1367834 [Mycena capillaripes]
MPRIYHPCSSSTLSITMSLTPNLLTISSSTRAIFSPDGVCITWEAERVQISVSESAQVDRSSLPKVVEELKFDHEEILDVAVNDDGLFILTGIPTGTQWRRQLKRHEYLNEDPWTKDRPLYSYGLRLFSVQNRSQTGDTLWLPDAGVNAAIRAGTHKAIVKSIGPNCYASIWQAPSVDGEWHCLHQELSWDPDIIAKKIGFQNHQEELAHITETHDHKAPVGLGWRY